jgi:hypothetical protein
MTDKELHETAGVVRQDVPEVAKPPARPWYTPFGNVAQIASALIALVGFSVVIYQIAENRRKSADEAYRAELGDARRNYALYSDAGLRYPHLSDPDYDALMRNHIEYVRYKNFVEEMIYAYDDILNVLEQSNEPGVKDGWLLSFAIDIEAHHRYLCQITDRRFFAMYRPRIQATLQKAMGNCAEQERSPLVEVK